MSGPTPGRLGPAVTYDRLAPARRTTTAGTMPDREPIIDPDDGQVIAYVDHALGIPPWKATVDRGRLVHRVRWVQSGAVWTACAIAVRADWLLLPIDTTPIFTGAADPLEVCDACTHQVLDATTGTPAGRELPAGGRVIEGSVHA